MNIFRRIKALEIVLDGLIAALEAKGTITRPEIQKHILLHDQEARESQR